MQVKTTEANGLSVSKTIISDRSQIARLFQRTQQATLCGYIMQREGFLYCKRPPMQNGEEVW